MNEIQKIRKKTNLSQSKFAERFGIPVRTIQKWEIGQASPPHYLVQMVKKLILFEQAEVIRQATTIPDSLKGLFWDCKVDELNLEKNCEYIIARLYNFGGVSGRMWAEMYYSPEQIKKAACSRRDLDPIVANYLKNVFKLNPNDMAYYNDAVQNSNWKGRYNQ